MKYIGILYEIFLDFLCYSECLEVSPSEGNVSLLDLFIFLDFFGGEHRWGLDYLIILLKFRWLMLSLILCYRPLLHGNHVHDNNYRLEQLP